MTIDAPRMLTEVPGPRSRAELQRLGNVLYAHQGHEALPFVVESRERGVVVDVDANRFLDLSTSGGTNPFGLPPGSVLEAAAGTLADFGNEDVHHLTNPTVTALARRLIDAAPASLTRVDMALSGTEAVEIALRLMRRATGRPLVLGFHRQNHGETAAAIGLGAASAGRSKGMRQMTPGFVHVPHPYRSPFEPAIDGCGDATIDYIRRHLLFHAVDPGDVAGVVVQPVTREAVAPPDGFWPSLVELCRQHGWLLCADEVASGMSRTGPIFAVDRWKGQPDLLCVGESLSAGAMPIGAILGSEKVMATFSDTETGSTWSWLPAACSAAVAGLDELDRQGVSSHVAEMESIALKRLPSLCDHDQVDDVRVRGALAGIEFTHPDFGQRVAAEALRRGVVGMTGESFFGLMPPLTMPLADYDRGLGIVVAAIETMATSV